MKPFFGALGAFVMLAMVGCEPPATHVKNAPMSLPDGWTVAENKEQGLAVGVVPGWRSGAGMLPDAATTMSDMGVDVPQGMAEDPNNPAQKLMGEMDQMSRLSEAKAMAELAKKGIYVHVIDSSKPIIGEERTRYYIKKKVQDRNATLDDAAADEKTHVIGADKPVPVDLPIGKAMRIEGEGTTRGGDKVTHISYVAVDGKNVYILRFASTNNPDSIRSIDKQVAQTWRIVPKKG